MDNVVTITNTKQNFVEFDINIQGVDTSDMVAHFIIETNNMNIGFKATRKENSEKWEVVIPPLGNFIEKTAYNYHIDVIVDGYHFEGTQGTVNVVGTAELYTSTPKTVPITSSDKNTDIKVTTEQEQVTPLKQREKPIAQIARELMEQSGIDNPGRREVRKVSNKAKIALEENGSDAPTTADKDEMVKSILSDMGFTPKEKPKKPKFSFTTH